MSEWQPIDTAPKDQTCLVSTPGGAVWWATFRLRGTRTGWRWEAPGLGALRWQPTHWMPLPEPPKP